MKKNWGIEVWIAAVVAVFLWPTATAQVVVGVDQAARHPRFRADRLIIQPRPASQPADLAAVHQRHGSRVVRAFPAMGNLQVLSIPANISVAEAVARYRESGLVEFAEPDYWLKAAAVPNDPRYTDGTLWGLHNTGLRGGLVGADIDAPAGWETLNSASNIIVAIIDSGIRYTHEDLAANMWVNPKEIPGNRFDDDGDGIVDDIHGINSINDTGDPKDDSGHGTHVAGIIGAVGNNGKGVVGVAWKVQLMALKFMDSSGFGATSDAIQCIDFARSKGAKIINASWGGTDNSLSLRSAISRARSAGIIFVAAAGNESVDNDTSPNYPSSFDLDNIVAVGSSTRTDAFADFSDFGAKTVDLVAPGDTIYSTWSSSDTAYAYLSGTSMSTPYITGALALMAARFPNDTYKQLIDRLYAATETLPGLAGKCVTGGRLNLRRALAQPLLANFTTSAAFGSPPLPVNFNDASVGDVIRRTWNFGDGTATSADLNPTHVFEGEGSFSVSLTLDGANGITDVKSRVITVVANYQIVSTNINWIDPSTMTRLVLSDNGVSPAQILPFPFVFYGQTYDRIYVGANGVIGFNNQGLTTTVNTDLPTTEIPNAIICPYWDNLNPASGGAVRIGTVGAAPNRRTVISWVNVPRNSTSGSSFTFQAVLNESSHQILFQYLEVQPNSSRGGARLATVGLENESGFVAAKYTVDGIPAVLSNNQALLFIPQSSGGMVVSPSAGFTASGPVGGPFSPSSQSFTIENTAQVPLRWLMGKTQSWLQLDQTSGVLDPGQQALVTVSLADSARTLKVGTYSDTIAFINEDTGRGNTARSVTLAVNGTTGMLTVSPDSALISNGSQGGPFNPGSQVYTLVNSGDATLAWTASNSESWVTLSASSGTLAPGDSATLTVQINGNAAGLTPGFYSDAVFFTNASNGLGNGARAVTLTVLAPSPAQLTLQRSESAGQFRLRISGEAGKTYTIEMSNDLENWTPLFTNTTSPDGFFEFTDLANSSGIQKFYRAVLKQ